jgi:hypothetical protein
MNLSAHDCGFGWERAVSMPVIDPDARALLYLRTYLTLGHKSGGAWRPSQAAMCGGKAPCSVS